LTLGSLTMVGSLKFDCLQATGFAAEDLRGMIAQKRTIARAPEARTIASRKVCGWRSRDSLRKIDVGLPGGYCPVSQVSLSKVISSQRGVFKNQSSSLISPQVAIKKSQPTQPPCETGWFLVAIDSKTRVFFIDRESLIAS